MANEEDVKRYLKCYMEMSGTVRRANILSDDNSRKFMALYHLLTFEKNNGRQMTISDLAKLTCMAMSNVSRFLRPLEEKGFVARRRDGRTVYLSITPQGEKFFAEKEDEVIKVVGEFLGSLTDEELATLLDISEKITASLNN